MNGRSDSDASRSAGRPASTAELHDRALESLAAALGGAREVALLNFPNHGNPGDPALWLGAESLLRRLGVRIRYRAAHWSFDPAALRRAMPNGTILLNGGGNFGDLYRGQQQTREHVIAEMREYRIVQLPQSIQFRSSSAADDMAELMRRHGAVTLMVREQASLDRARSLFDVETLLSPDQVYGLGTLVRGDAQPSGIVWMVWGEGALERNARADPPGGADVREVDWIEGGARAHLEFDRRGRAAWNGNRMFQRHWAHPVPRALHPLLASTFAPLARRWLDAGVRVLDSAEVVVTNKLHGHILCTLLGVPHVVLDNSYGKVGSTLDTWTGSLPGVHRASDGEEAYEIARSLQRDGAAHRPGATGSR